MSYLGWMTESLALELVLIGSMLHLWSSPAARLAALTFGLGAIGGVFVLVGFIADVGLIELFGAINLIIALTLLYRAASTHINGFDPAL